MMRCLLLAALMLFAGIEPVLAVGYPAIAATNSNGNAATTTQTVNLPSGISAGDLLIFAIGLHNISPSITTPTGWTLLQNSESGTSGQNLATYYKIATGSEGASVSVTTVNAASNAISWRISAGTFDAAVAPAVGSPQYSSTTTPQAPALTPSWAVSSTLWIAMVTCPGGAVSAYPASFTLNQIDSSAQGGLATPRLGAAARDDTVTTETPGTFTCSATGNDVAYLVGIKPAAARGGVINIPILGM
ncbi:MAG: hypothetical protein P4M15_12190 [Alphaproteobacteria bacterium]|nr:hypothetical protein [Alphaproteobacteria bacterium]